LVQVSIEIFWKKYCFSSQVVERDPASDLDRQAWMPILIREKLCRSDRIQINKLDYVPARLV
jgi:hypothetical protein